MIVQSNDPTGEVGNMQTGEDAEDCGIRMCDEHHLEIVAALEKEECPYAKTEEELAVKIKKNEPDALFEVTRCLMTVGLKVMGSVELLKFRCPVCALRKFDFIGQTTAVISEKVKETTSKILTPPDRRVELIRPN